MDNQTLSIKPKYGYGFIYCYTSPSGKKYIGQTRTTLKDRAKQNAKGYKGCTAFYNAIQKYGWENFEVEILKEVPLDVLDEEEIWAILDNDTCNKDKGYNIMQDKHKYLATLKYIPVFCYDGITGAFVREYESISDAERDMKVYRGTIRRVLNNLSRHVKGYVWTTQQTDFVEVVKNNIQPAAVGVYMYNKQTGELINQFASLREAARETGYDRALISNLVRGGYSLKCKNYLFKNYKVDNLYNESSTTIRKE